MSEKQKTTEEKVLEAFEAVFRFQYPHVGTEALPEDAQDVRRAVVDSVVKAGLFMAPDQALREWAKVLTETANVLENGRRGRYT
jgi:hypothetical protein